MFANATNDQLAQIQDILQQLDRATVNKDTENRRSIERIIIRSAMTTILLAARGLPSFTVFSRNISRSGIGFISRRPFKPEERAAISFQIPSQPHKLVLIKTTFSRYVRAGVYEVGGEFIECVADTRGADRIPQHWLPTMMSTSPAAIAPRN